MATFSNPIDTASDGKCETACKLELGSSERFKSNLVEQQIIKASKAHITPQIFSDPKKQAFYCKLLNDVMMKTFDSPDEQKIFQAALEGMKRNYPDILSGKEKNMFFCPAAFNFDSRIGTFETSVPEELETTQAVLEAKQTLSAKEKKDLKVIQEHLKKIRPQIAEQEFFDALACFFYPYRGIFVHSLKLDQHLKALTDKARLYRKQNKNVGFGLTTLEKKLVEQFNISEQSLTDTADKIITRLKQKGKVTPSKTINGRTIRETIDEELKGNEKASTQKHFKSGQNYSLDDIKDGVKLGKFESDCRFAGENDLLIMLPDLKLFVCVEIKRHMKPDERKNQQLEGTDKSNQATNATLKPLPNIDGNLQSAASQLKKNANFTSLMHGAILSPGWRFVKVAAISPYVYNKEKICRNCNKFILTTEMLREPGGISKWWKQTGLLDGTQNFDQKTKNQCYEEFQLFFNRLVNLSAVRVVPDPFHTWVQIQGDNPRHMSAGYTKTKCRGTIDVKDALKLPHDAYKVLYFNKDQQALLTTDELNVVFFCDFGSGKSLLCKEKAIQEAEKEEKAKDAGDKPIADPVYYISLVGVDEWGFVEQDEYIFDTYTKLYDFVGADIKVKSAQDLWAFYKQHQKVDELQQTKTHDIYKIVELFIKNNSNGHFIIDECPILRGYYRHGQKYLIRAQYFLSTCQQHLGGGSKLFWVAFQSNVLADMAYTSDDIFFGKKKFDKIKHDLTGLGWVFPGLASNMRNQKNISSITVQDPPGELYVMQHSIKKLESTVVGEVSTLVKVKADIWKIKQSEVLKHVVDMMNEKNDKNIVLLHDLKLDTKQLESSLMKITDKTIVTFPPPTRTLKTYSYLKTFIENGNHILVTKDKHFSGCEASNVIYITESGSVYNTRSSFMRAVENLIIIEIKHRSREILFTGLKEDNTFL